MEKYMINRKSFIKTAGVAGLGSALLPKFSFGAAKGSDKIKVAILGCGGRGRGAMENMLSADQNIEFIAAGDIFPKQIERAGKRIAAYAEKKFGKRDVWKVSPDTTFVGLDAIDKIVQTDADVIMLTTPPVFRPYHIEKCLKAGKNVFAEKPIAIDAVGLRKIYNELIPLADKAGLTVICGTQMRYHSAIAEGVERVRDGQIGDVVGGVFLRYVPLYLMRQTLDAPAESLQPDDAEYQLRNWLGFRWTSGDHFVELFVHNLDMALWAFGQFPIEAVGSGGRQANLEWGRQGDRQSNTHVQYEFANGATLTAACRQEPNTTPYATFKVIGTKGVLEMSFGKQRITGEKPWVSEHAKKQALVCEHEVLLGAIRNGKPINTMKTCADSCYAAVAGRESAYAGKRLKCRWVLEKSKLDYMPKDLSLDGKVALQPVPNPTDYKLI